MHIPAVVSYVTCQARCWLGLSREAPLDEHVTPPRIHRGFTFLRKWKNGVVLARPKRSSHGHSRIPSSLALLIHVSVYNGNGVDGVFRYGSNAKGLSLSPSLPLLPLPPISLSLSCSFSFSHFFLSLSPFLFLLFFLLSSCTHVAEDKYLLLCFTNLQLTLWQVPASTPYLTRS